MRSLMLFMFFLILMLPEARAQSEEKLFKEYNSTSLSSILRADYYLKNNSFLYFENTIRYGEEFPLGFNFPTNIMQRVNTMVGYQHMATEKWYMGASIEAVNLSRNAPSIFTALNITHMGKVAKI